MRPTATTPLGDLEQLSPSVYLSEPAQKVDALDETCTSGATRFAIPDQTTSKTSPKPTSLGPKLIILCSWMAARPNHILKYVQSYRHRYPASRIIIVRSTPADLIYRRASTQQQRLAPAISAVLSSCTDNSHKPQILLHIFSNGGSQQAHNLFFVHRAVTTSPFPPHVTIFDSCPGRATFKRTVLALSSALPLFPPARLLSLILIYLVRLRQTLNSRTIMQAEMKRCYIYSKADSMVGWRDVEDHAHAAIDHGFVVQCEKYEASEHCAHQDINMGNKMTKAVLGEQSYEYLNRGGAAGARARGQYNPYSGNNGRLYGNAAFGQPGAGHGKGDQAGLHGMAGRRHPWEGPPILYTGEEGTASYQTFSAEEAVVMYGPPRGPTGGMTLAQIEQGERMRDAVRGTLNGGEDARKARIWLYDMGFCELGFVWLKEPGGWRCRGEQHYMSDEEYEAYLKEQEGEGGEGGEGGEESVESGSEDGSEGETAQ
ncbi:MAG: hypothetical protein Q9186_006218 [Xanthomendoza sp. 1 TL-2023]